MKKVAAHQLKISICKKLFLITLVLSFFSTATHAQIPANETVLTIINTYQSGGNEGGVTINIYDANTDALLHTYSNVNVNHFINPANWGGNNTTPYKAGYSGMTIFITNGNVGYPVRIQELNQWGTTPFAQLNLRYARNMTIMATDTPNFAPDASIWRLFRENNQADLFDASAADIGTWNTSNVTNMQEAFYATTNFNPANLGNWDTSNVTNMSYMFRSAHNMTSFDIGNWDVGRVTNFTNMFAYNSLFNTASINNWNIGENTGTDTINMSYMFLQVPSFNTPLSGWERAPGTNGGTDPGSTMAYVSNMFGMFQNAGLFNQNIGGWNVGRVTNFQQMFYSGSNTAPVRFNNGDAFGVLGTNMQNWNVGANLAPGETITMTLMFGTNHPNNLYAEFNQNLGNWDVTKVTNFNSMFRYNTGFTGAGLSGWNISGSNTDPVNMSEMFFYARAFNESLSNWEDGANSTMQYVTTTNSMFEEADAFNQDLGGWNVSRVISFSEMFYRANVFNNGDAASIVGTGMRDWNIGSNLTTENISMYRMFRDTPVFNQDLSNWDVTKVTQFTEMFYNADAFTGDGEAEVTGGSELLTSGLSNWKISGTETDAVIMTNMFGLAPVFNEPLNSWETNAGSTMAYVTHMNAMFNGALIFNHPLGDWDVGRVITFGATFANMNAFADPAPSINTWNIGQNTGTTGIAMNSMFNNSNAFNTPLASWETNANSSLEYVSTMNSMFMNADIFNQDLGDWNVSRVRDFAQMFYRSSGSTAFNNGDASGAIGTGMQSWNMGANLTGNETITMYRMFRQSQSFNQNLSGWDVRRVNNFQETFYWTEAFTGAGLRDWQISGSNTFGITMRNMFGVARAFVEPLATWETGTGSTMGYVTNMREMFNNTDNFNHPIGAWDVGRVTNFIYMFLNDGGFTDPEPSIANWNIGQNTGTAGINMQGMFQANTAFNNPLEDWERAANTPDKDPRPSTMAYVTTMRDMFRNGAIFNNTVNTWNVGRVGDFHAMFHLNPNFNQPVNNWNIGENRGNGINMQYMFGPATAFNQPVNQWDVSKVQHFFHTFNGATSFDQSLAAWTPITGTDFRNMLSNSGLSVANYDATLTSWAQQDLIDNRVLGAVNLEFCAAEPFRASLVTDQGWTIQGDALGCAPGNVSGSGTLFYWVTAGAVPANDGDLITEWRDISGDGRVFAQTTPANQPTLLKNTTDMVNFNPLMKFDGADDFVEGYDFNTLDPSFPTDHRNTIPDTRSASSVLVTGTPPNEITYGAGSSGIGNTFNTNATGTGSWRPANLPTENANTTEYLQLDFGEIVPISTIRTQGELANQRPNNWVTSYTVEISTDGTNYTQLDGVFTGNTDRSTRVRNQFSANTPAQYVRIYPQTWSGYPALSVDVGSNGYNALSTFVLAVEDSRQNNVTQSINHLDTNNRLDISVTNGAGNATVDNSFNGNGSVALSDASPAVSDKPFLINYSVTGTGEARLYRNGDEVATDASPEKYSLMGTTYLGGLPTDNYFNGKIAEANLFGVDLDQSQRERINTYFAIKYNIPLQHNFIYEDENEDIVTVWDKTTNADYDNDVFGLAKDDNQGLNQGISSSRNDDDKVLTVATVRDFANLNSDPGRLSLTGTSAFVVVGNDDGDTSFSINNAPNKFKMMNRKWYAQVTGNDQPLFFEFNVGLPSFDIPDTEQTPDYYLLIDSNSDGDLSDEQPVLMTNTSGDLWSTPNAVTVADGQIFTVAYAFTVFPGGVAPNLALWLKGDAGTIGDAAMTEWEDQSVNNNHFAHRASTNNPDATARTTNFNPAVTFDGDAGFELFNNDLGLAGNTDLSYFFVSSIDDLVDSQTLMHLQYDNPGDSNLSNSRHFRYSGTATTETLRRGSPNDGSINGSTGIAAPINPIAGLPNISAYQRSGTDGIFSFNSLLGTTSTDDHIPPTFQEITIGIRQDGINVERLTGNIEEIIAYNVNIAPFEKLRVESYLALKYGITLNQDTATNYVASDWDGSMGTLMWDSAVDTDYNSDIFGIGQDEAAGLNQKVSKSINGSTVMTVSLDDDDFTKLNNAVVNGHTNNLQFMSFASNGLETTDQTTELDAANYNLGISREWQVYKTTNFTDAVNLKFEGFGGYDVIQSTDDDFSTAGDQTVLGTLDDNGELTNVTGLVSGRYLSLAIYAQAPGGVTSNLALWLKANEGVEGVTDVTTWNDQSLNDYHATTVVSDPQNSANEINFNPSILFDGDDNLEIPVANVIPTGNNDFAAYVVASNNDGGRRTILNQGNSGASGTTLFEIEVASTGSNLVNRFDLGGTDLNQTTPISTNQPFLYDVHYDSATNTTYGYTFGADEQTLNSARNGATGFNTKIGGGLNFWDGNISEIIVYDASQENSSIEQRKIESYLALKYGITLDRSVQDYVASDGTEVFTTTAQEEIVYQDNSTPNDGFSLSTPDLLYTPLVDEIFQSITIASITEDFSSSGTVVMEWTDPATSTMYQATTNVPADYQGSIIFNFGQPLTMQAGVQQRFSFSAGTLADLSAVTIDMVAGGSGRMINSAPTQGSHSVPVTITNISNPDAWNDVFGIGRDDASSLNQEVSKSINSGTILTASTTNDFTSPNDDSRTDLADMQFLVMGNNGMGTNTIKSEQVPAGYNVRTARIWQAQNTNNVGAVNLKFDGYDETWSIVVDTDVNFSNGSATPLNANGEVTVTLSNNASFTLVSNIIAPGGVIANNSLWLKADADAYSDAGVTNATDNDAIQQWVDQSPNGFIANQPNAGDEPSFADNVINFNPSIAFEAANTEDLHLDHTQPGTAPRDNESYTVFSVGTINATTGLQTLYDASDVEATVNESARFFIQDDEHRMDWGANELLSGPGSISDNTPFMVTHRYDNTTGREVYTEGSLSNSDTETNFNANNIFRVRIGSLEALHLDGQISELVFYKASALSATDRQKVESYLALKYGITIDASSSNYLNSDATSVYDLSSYSNDVFGIARDNDSGLDQQISKSVNDGSILTISTDTNFTSSNGSHTSLNEGQFLVIGNDGGNGAIPATKNITDLDTSVYGNRSAREWKSINTGSVGTVQLQFDSYNNDWVLLTRTTDGNFSATTGTTETALSATGTVAVSLTGTTYFTLAQKAIPIAFELAANSDLESDGGNLPRLIIQGVLNSSTDIDIVVNATSVATLGNDFEIGGVTGALPQTVTVTIPAGTYNAATPIALNDLNLSGTTTGIDFEILDDLTPEFGNETVVLNLSNPQGVLQIANVTGGTPIDTFTYTILDDDAVDVSATGTRISATDGAAFANGVDTEEVWVQIQNGSGTPLPLSGYQVTFSVTGNATLSSATATTDSNGRATITITNITAESVNVTATIDDDKDGGTTPELNVVNGSPAEVIFSYDAATLSVFSEILEDSDSPGGANNANNTAVTVTQLGSIPGIMNVDPSFEICYQQAIQAETEFSNLPTFDEVQSIIDRANLFCDVLAQIGREGDYPDTTPSVVTVEQMETIFPTVYGLIPSHEELYQAYIDNYPFEFSEPATQAEVQGMVTAVNTSQSILAQIGTEGDEPDVIPSATTIEEFNTILGLENVIPANESQYQSFIDIHPDKLSSPATLEEVQAMIDEVNTVAEIVRNSNDPADGNPSLNDLTAAGLENLDPEYLDQYEEAIANADPAPVCLEELQIIIDAVNSVENGMLDALSEILEDSNSVDGNNNGNGTPVTVEQLEAIVGLNNVEPANELCYQLAIQSETDFSNLPTLEEVQRIIDLVNSKDEDADNDGLSNEEEDANGDCNFTNDDCDDDGIPNYLDSDSCGEVGSIATISPADAFTPNGDGMNDYWVITGIENYPNALVKVYNRYGHEVFSAVDYQNDWDGTFRARSKKLPPGSYHFVINLADGSRLVKGWLFINY